jgi:hypothetical protein
MLAARYPASGLIVCRWTETTGQTYRAAQESPEWFQHHIAELLRIRYLLRRRTAAWLHAKLGIGKVRA